MSQAPAEELPAFPSRSVRSRITELGYGSGLWERAELEARWGASIANKVIDEAKRYGWLVSPFRGQFWVPTAPDLMTVAWLPPRLREEFTTSRALYASGLRFWCLSDWARKHGLLLPQPVFVTDLSPRTEKPDPPRPPLDVVKDRAHARLPRIRKIPFLDRLVIVPQLGTTSSRMRSTLVTLYAGRPEKVPPFTLPETLSDNDPPGEPANEVEPGIPTTIRFPLTPSMEDTAWLIAFLIALDLGRTGPLVRDVMDVATRTAPKGKRARHDLLAEAGQWAAYFGQPMPTEDWRRTDAFPYLLVPAPLWEEVSAAGISRAYSKTQALREG